MSRMSEAIAAMKDEGLGCDGRALGFGGRDTPCQYAYPAYGGELDEVLLECSINDRGGCVGDCPHYREALEEGEER